MEEKIFNLMEKMYVDLSSKIDGLQSELNGRIDGLQSEVTGIKSEVAGIKSEVTGIKSEVTGIKSDVTSIRTEIKDMKSNMATKHDIVRLENKMDYNFKALYDGYQQSIEGISELRGEIKELTSKVENQEIRLQVLKTAK